MDKVSFIIPVYNVEKYLKKCIKSVLDQSYQNIEVLLIDDGSTDGSLKICDDYAKKDSRIKVFHKENEGLSATRNLGVKLSTGKYITFIDSDDTISEDFCETLLNAIKTQKCDVASVSLVMTRVNGYKIETSNDTEVVSHDNELRVYTKKDILKEVLLRKSFKNYICTKLYRRELFDHCLFKEKICYEDVLFTYEMTKHINKIAYVDKVCYNYLKRRNSITATCSEKNLNDFLDVALYRYEDVKKNHPECKLYNTYALLETIISVSIKYVIAHRKYQTVAEKSNHIFDIICDELQDKDLELKLIPLLKASQKTSLYLMLYNRELFYNFLEKRQKMKTEGTI